MADGDQLGIQDIVTRTKELHAELLTAKASNDSQIVHASIITAIEGLLGCVRTIAAELVRVEIEGIDEGLPGA